MPTGYTDKISNGITFQEYALDCARAFIIEMRDLPSGAPIPEKFTSSSHHSEELAKAKKKLKKINSMSLAACEKAAQADFDSRIEHLKDAVKREIDMKAKYEKMLAQVNDYAPPSNDHLGFKNFMREQIESSIDFDCKNYYLQELNRTRLLSGKQWRKMQMDSCLTDITYHTEGEKEDRQRDESKTKWVEKLRESLATK